jgi:hypothetical protein
MMAKLITNKDRQEKLNPDEVIVLYKAGSRGEVLDIHKSVHDIIDLENRLGRNSIGSMIYNILSGRNKSYISRHYKCKVRPVVRKRTDL